MKNIGFIPKYMNGGIHGKTLYLTGKSFRSEDYAFGHCFWKIRKIVVPKEIEFLSVNLNDFPSLKGFQVCKDNPYFRYDSFSKSLLQNRGDGTYALILALPGRKSQYVLPKNVTKICDYAFRGTNYRSVVARKGQMDVKVTQLALKDSIIERASNGYCIIGDTVVFTKKEIDFLDLPKTVEHAVFEEQRNIPLVQIARITKAKQIDFFRIVDDGKLIYDGDFDELLHSSLHDIHACPIAEIEVNDERYVVKNNIVYTRDMKKLVFFPRNMKYPLLLKEVFPETVQEIGEEAFFATCIQQITIPGSVKIIGRRAFAHSELQKIVLHEGVEEVKQKAFFSLLERKQKSVQISIPLSIRKLEEGSLLGIDITKLQDNSVKGVVKAILCDSWAGLYQNNWITLQTADGEVYYFPTKVEETYVELMNRAWNRKDKKKFQKLYQKVPFHADMEIDELTDYGLFIYQNDKKAKRDFVLQFLREKTDVFGYVMKFLQYGEEEQAAEIIKLGAIDNEEKLKALLEKSREQNMAALSAYLLNQCVKIKNASDKEGKFKL